MNKTTTLKETTSMIRKTLKTQFPGIKFTVRSDKFMGGAAIQIGWIDGPAAFEIDEIVSEYEGGEATYIQTYRQYSNEFATYIKTYAQTAYFGYCDNELISRLRAKTNAANLPTL